MRKLGANIKPLYQQDKGTYALDLGGYNEVSSNPKWQEPEVRSMYPEVDEDEANVEAERGETILTPDMERYDIGGKKHSQGGTFLDVDPGSFIFSDDRSLRIKGSVLEEFGINPNTKKGKKGYTPAEISKKYPTNKFLAILRDKNSDDMDIETAEMSLGSMTKKLSKLAFLQESMKGFPEGVPSFVEEMQSFQKGGSVPKFQPGGERKTGTRKMSRGKKVVWDPNALDITGAPGAWVDVEETPSVPKKPSFKELPAPEAASSIEVPQTGRRRGTRIRPKRRAWETLQQYNERVQYDKDADDGYGGRGAWINLDPKSSESNYKSSELEPHPGIPWVHVQTDKLVGSDRQPVREARERSEYFDDAINSRGRSGAWVTYEEKTLPEVVVTGKREKAPGATTQKTDKGQEPLRRKEEKFDSSTFIDPTYDVGYGAIDYMNMAAPYSIGINKYYPTKIKINPQYLDYNPLDFQAQRQAIMGQAATAYDANNMLSTSSPIAAARNSGIFGQTLDPLSQSYMQEFNVNQGIKSQIEGLVAQFRQQADQLNAAAADQYKERTDLVNENYDNDRRLRLKAFFKSFNAAEKSRQIKNASNFMNQDYMIDANGNIIRKPSSYDPNRSFWRLTGDGDSSFGIPSFTDFKNSLPKSVVNSSTERQLWDDYQKRYYFAANRGRDAQNINATARQINGENNTPNPYDYTE